VKGIAERTLTAVFKASGVPGAHARRFRHTLATNVLARGARLEDIAEILGNSPAIVYKHYAQWSPERQERIDALMRAAEFGTFLAHQQEQSVIN